MTTEASDHVEGQAEGWRPEPGSVVEGTLVDVTEATSTQRNQNNEYPKYPLLRIKQPDGAEVLVHAFHNTLKQAIFSRRPEIGHRIRVTFHGKQKLKSDPSRSVALYSIELPDTPKTAGSIYDRLERSPVSRSGPAAPAAEPQVEADDDFDF